MATPDWAAMTKEQRQELLKAVLAHPLPIFPWQQEIIRMLEKGPVTVVYPRRFP